MINGDKLFFVLMEGDIMFWEVVSIICDVFEKGFKDFGIIVKFIFCCVEYVLGDYYCN